MNTRDILVILVTLGGILAGVAWPGPAGGLAPLTVYFLMTLLFLSFLRLDFKALLHPAPGMLWEVLWWTLAKLILAPLICFCLAAWLLPAWALPVLVLTAMSAGVSGPFFASMLGADMVRVLMVVVATSLLVPFTLPALVRLLAGAETGISFGDMFRLLAMVIFSPLALLLLLRRLVPGLLESLAKISFPVSLGLLFLISAAVFAPFGGYVLASPRQFLLASLLAFALAAIYLGLALLFTRLGRGRLDALTGQVAMVYINNVLALVFAGRFLDTESVLLAGCYLLPYYLALLPLRYLSRRRVPPAGH
jgi:BASS family bile acid:Na+ symporter